MNAYVTNGLCRVDEKQMKGCAHLGDDSKTVHVVRIDGGAFNTVVLHVIDMVSILEILLPSMSDGNLEYIRRAIEKEEGERDKEENAND